MFGFASRAISSILTVLYLITAIGACSVQPQEESSYFPAAGIPLGQSSEEVAIYVLQSMPEISGEFQQAMAQYEEASTDHIRFHIQTVPGRADYRTTLRSRVLADEPVDLFHLFSTDDAVVMESHLEEITDTLPWAMDGLVPPLTIGQEAYGVPYGMEGIGLIVNRQIFQAAGIDPSTLTEFERLQEAFQELQEMIDAGDLQENFPHLDAVTALPAQDTDYLGSYPAEVLLTGSFTSPMQAYYSNSVAMVDEDSEGFIKLLIRYSPQRSAWPGLVSVTESQAVENGLAAQRVAAILHSTEVFRRVYAVNPELEGNLALVPVSLEEAEQGSVYLGTPAYWAVNQASDRAVKDQAFALLEWLYRSDEGATVLADRFLVCSPYQDTAADTGLVLHRQLLSYANNHWTQPKVAQEAPARWGEEVLAAELQEYYTILDKQWGDVIENSTEQWAARRQGVQ